MTKHFLFIWLKESLQFNGTKCGRMIHFAGLQQMPRTTRQIQCGIIWLHNSHSDMLSYFYSVAFNGPRNIRCITNQVFIFCNKRLFKYNGTDERQSKTIIYTNILSALMKLAVWSQQTSITCFYRTNPMSGFTLTSIFIQWRASSPPEPRIEGWYQVWAVFHIASGKAETMVQQWLCIWHGQGWDDPQKRFFQFLVKLFLSRRYWWNILLSTNNQHREPNTDKLQSHLQKTELQN